MTNRIHRIADDHVTAVEIEFDPPTDWGFDDPLVAVGTARRQPEDQYDAVIGDELAYGRALIHLGKQIVKDGLARSHKQSLEAQLAESLRRIKTKGRNWQREPAPVEPTFGVGDVVRLVVAGFTPALGSEGVIVEPATVYDWIVQFPAGERLPVSAAEIVLVRTAEQERERKERSAVIDTLTDPALFAAGKRLLPDLMEREVGSGRFCRTSDTAGSCGTCDGIRSQVRAALRKEAGLE